MTTGGRIPYVASLDGVRAVAVIAVVLFHADIAPFAGGFTGVTVFFTLSGFLIASLLIAEHRSNGRIALGDFYVRRARRLLPAAWLCLGGVLVAGASWSDTQREALGGDVLASLANVANWRFAYGDNSYQELLNESPSPVAHFWSLAIEEQMYLFVPLLIALAVGFGRRCLLAVVGVLTVASVVSLVATDRFDVAYNATHTRAAELLIGVALAVALSSPRVQLVLSRDRARSVLAWAGGLALAVLVAAAVVVRLDDRWLVNGGLAGVAVVAAVLVASLVVGPEDSPVSRLLATAPLVSIGKVSYGAYLFHWPIFVWMTPVRIGVDGAALFVLRITAVAVVTMLSYTFIEQPIRRGTTLAGPVPAFGALAVAGGLLVVGVTSIVPPEPSETELLIAGAQGGVVTFETSPQIVRDATLDEASSPPDHTPIDMPPEQQQAELAALEGSPDRPVVLVAGSDRFAIEALNDLDVDVVDAVQDSCPVATGAEARFVDGTVLDISACESIVDRMARFLDTTQPSVIVVSLGPLDEGLLRRTNDIGFPSEDDLAEFGARRAAAEEQLDKGVEVLLGEDVPIVFGWWGDDGLVHGALERFAVRHERVAGVFTTHDDLASSVRQSVTPRSAVRGVADEPPAPTTRVVVIGDSTSLHLARALHDAEASLDVVWAGQSGCALVRVRAIRIQRDQPLTELTCDDFAITLPPLIERFQPDVVVAMAGPIEVAEQFYDDVGHLPGSDAWVEHHDAEIVELLAAIGDGIPVLIADAPPIVPGSFSTQQMSEPARTDAWNAQIARWITRYEQIDLLAYAAPLAAYEAAHGSIRPDGVHPEVEPLTELARQWLIEQVLAVDRTSRGARD